MRRRRLQRLAGAVLLAPLVLSLATTGVRADAVQTDGGTQQDEAVLGGYTLVGRANAVRLLYDLPGSLPIGPLVEVAAPEATTRLATGPVGSALSAMGYPGPIVLGWEALMAQGGFESPLPIPDYPLAVSATTSGPTEVRDDRTVPGGSMHARAEGAEAEAVTVSPSNDASPILSIAGSRSSSRSSVASTAETTATVEVAGVVALGGMLRIDSVRSALRASSDGETGRTGGGTTVAGASFLGQPVEIDGDGIRFTDPPPAADPVAAPLDAALAEVLSQFGGLDEALAEAGIRIRLADPRATGAGAAAELVTEGVTIEIEQELGAGPLGQLLALVPLLPDVPGPPVGPNDLVQVIQARQVTSISIGRAEVAAAAAPAFELPPLGPGAIPPGGNVPVAEGASPSGSPAFGGGPSGAGPPGAPGTPAGALTGPIADTGPLGLPGVVGPGVVLAALVGGVLLSLGTRKLPDWALDGAAVATATCDRAIEGGSP